MNHETLQDRPQGRTWTIFRRRSHARDVCWRAGAVGGSVSPVAADEADTRRGDETALESGRKRQECAHQLRLRTMIGVDVNIISLVRVHGGFQISAKLSTREVSI